MLDSFFTVVFWFAFAAVLAVALYFSLKANRSMRDSFAALVFQTPEGSVSGAKMRVVKEVLESTGQDLGASPTTGFFYCVGPGPSYFVAIANLESAWRARFAWVIRPLTEERMRGALVGDSVALLAAFGNNLRKAG